MSFNIIIKSGNRSLKSSSKDALHKRRKELAGQMGDGMFSKDKMNQHDCKSESDERKRVGDYDRWRDTNWRGQTNKQRMKEWSDCNREFKKRGEEGKPMCIDMIRERKNVKYE